MATATTAKTNTTDPDHRRTGGGIPSFSSNTPMMKDDTNVVQLQEEQEISGIRFVDYVDESQLEHVMTLVGKDLSEPYSIFTYRYFLSRFPQLCILAVDTNNADEPIGCVVGKIDEEEQVFVNVDDGEELEVQPQLESVDETGAGADVTTTTTTTTVGYIGMLAVSESYRRRGIGKHLVRRILRRMKNMGCTSATLETEVSNETAQRLYQDCFGFIREELLVRYYLNWNDAYRLRLWF